MNNSNETIDADSNNINTKQVIKVIFLIVFVVSGFYFANFHNGLSEKNEVWGTFGDYFGGILNPVIAAFAFYLIAKTYELQKRELEATRSLLEVSTDAQKNQIKLAALTALLNSNLTKISLLCSERIELLDKTPSFIRHNIGNARSNRIIDTKNFRPDEDAAFDAWIDENHHILKYIDGINYEIKKLTENNDELKKQINDFLKEETK